MVLTFPWKRLFGRKSQTKPVIKPTAPTPEPEAPKGPTRTWVILGKRFKANTKSEARSLAKKEFGPLPPHTVVIEEKKR